MHRATLPFAAASLLALLPQSLRAQPLPPAPTGVQVTTQYGIEFSTIASPGNAAHPGPPTLPSSSQYPNAFGSVAYSYRMARTEVTTAQWLQFVNTFSTQSSFPTQLFGRPSFTVDYPLNWGAEVDPGYAGPGQRYRLRSFQGAAMQPVLGLSWKDAALYCNWLHNAQSSDPSALWNGAYDTATFGADAHGGFTDQVTHHPNARFWIPTYDEWAKGAWYDPNRNGPDQGGYWTYSTQSDDPPVYGFPGVGQANATNGSAGILLGAYPDVQTAWGLLDMAGAGAEWSEAVSPTAPWWPESNGYRALLGSYAQAPLPDALRRDVVGSQDPEFPSGRVIRASVRIAAAVPTPSAALPLTIALIALRTRRRRAPPSQLLPAASIFGRDHRAF